MIRAANTDPVPVSTYLLTTCDYRNFRLLLEVKQTTGDEHSPRHSAVAALGAHIQDGDEEVWPGQTEPTLGCVTIPFEAARASSITLALDGAVVDSDAFKISELNAEVELLDQSSESGRLRILEFEAFRRLDKK